MGNQNWQLFTSTSQHCHPQHHSGVNIVKSSYHLTCESVIIVILCHQPFGGIGKCPTLRTNPPLPKVLHTCQCFDTHPSNRKSLRPTFSFIMSYPKKSLDQFGFFQKLPAEIRLIIWDLVIDERRMLQIQRRVSSTADKGDHTKGWKIVYASTPSILRTNRESRNHALKYYRLLFPLEMNSNLYINDRLDSLYLFTPPYEVTDVDEDPIHDMWKVDGEMDLACVYLCRYGMMTSIVMDYEHLCYGDGELEISPEHAQRWAWSIRGIAHLNTLTFLRNGDVELTDGQRQISQPTSIPTVFDRLLRQCFSQLKEDDGLEEEVPFPLITICDSFRRIEE